jgi:hypothetical protein
VTTLVTTLTPEVQRFEVRGRANEAQVFRFGSEALDAVLRPGSEFPHHGVTRLHHRGADVEFVHPLYAILNLYRVAAVDVAGGGERGTTLGQTRTDGHTVDVAGNRVTLRWPATDQRRAVTTMTYTIAAPNQIDVDVRAQVEGHYRSFELFLSGYYHPEVEPYVYLARANFELSDEPGRFADEPELVPVVMNDIFRGGIPAFPRDEAGARILLDGRWDGIVRFSPMRYYQLPLVFATDARRRVAAVLMTRPEWCFAVSTGYHGPDPSDRFKRHNPQYLSFFGDEVRPGDERRARARLVVTELDAAMTQPLTLYEAFLRETARAER